MLGNFYNTFKNSNHQLPEAVLDIISKEIPENYGYVYNEQLKHYVATPLDKDEPQRINLSFDSDQISDYPIWAKENFNSMMEYLYRTQKKLKIGKAELLGRDGKKYAVSALHKNPFSKEENIVEEYIFPSPFPEGKKIIFETESGKKREITIRRVPCDSREYIKMSNTDFPALSMITFIPDVGCNKPGKLAVSVTPSKAESVFDAVFSLEILKGYVEGTLKLNGVCIGKPSSDNPNYDKSLLEEKLSFWNDVFCLEEKLRVKFNPQDKMNEDDSRVLGELVAIFIDDKDVKYKAPVEFITVNKEAIDDPDFKKISSTENKGLALSFVNGPQKIALMGAEFELFTIVLMVGFKIIRIETDDDMARLYIINAEENQWMLYKTCAFTRKQAAEEQKRMQKTYLNALN